MNPQFFNLIDNAEVSGQIDPMIVGCCAGITVNFASKLFQMDLNYGETEYLKLYSWCLRDLLADQIQALTVFCECCSCRSFMQ